jgi:hypothetical protein
MKNSVHPLPGLQERMNRRKKKSGRKGPRSWAWRLAETHEPHGSWQSAPRLFIFPPTTPSNSGNNFSSPTRRPLLVVVLDARWKKTKSLRFIPCCSRNKQILQVSQETRTETSRRRRITTSPFGPVSSVHRSPRACAAAGISGESGSRRGER